MDTNNLTPGDIFETKRGHAYVYLGYCLNLVSHKYGYLYVGPLPKTKDIDLFVHIGALHFTKQPNKFKTKTGHIEVSNILPTPYITADVPDGTG